MLLPVGGIMKVLTMHTADSRISLKYIYVAMRRCTLYILYKGELRETVYKKLQVTKLFTKGRLPLKVMSREILH